MTGRMQSYQQKRAMQQSLFLLVLTIVMLALFFLLIMPLTIRIYDAIKKGGGSLETDTIPPQAPIVSPILEATNSAQLAVTGYGEPLSTMKLMVNGAITDEAEADDQGNFEFMNVALFEGENRISVISLDEAENSAESIDQVIILDSQAPTLEISAPLDGSVITKRREQLTQVKGITEANSRVYLNEKLLFVDGQGNFSGSFQLAEGENILKFRSIDPAGNQIEKELHVVFQP